MSQNGGERQMSTEELKANSNCEVQDSCAAVGEITKRNVYDCTEDEDIAQSSQQSTIIELDISADEAVKHTGNGITEGNESSLALKAVECLEGSPLPQDMAKDSDKPDILLELEATGSETYSGKNVSVGALCGSRIVPIQGITRPVSSAVKRNEITGLFHGGISEKYSFTARQLSVHDALESSIPFLSTTNDGILHVLPGWTSSMLLQDLCYRFTTAGSWGASVPFVQNEESVMVRKRKYQCNGVKVCPLLPSTFRHARHSCRAEYDCLQRKASDFGSCPQRSNIMVLQRARSVYLSVTREDKKYCMFIGKDPSDETKQLPCQGSPIVRTNRVTGEQFLGCTGYRTNFKDPHSSARGNAKVHASRTLRDLGTAGKELLQNMLVTGDTKLDSKETCFYVTQKSSRKTTCPAHGYTLQETGPCPARMLLVEPVWQQNVSFRPEDLARGQIPDRAKLVTYAMCKGEHFHPPPPPPLATSKKAQLIVHEALHSRDANPALIKLRTQLELDKKGAAYGRAISIDNDQLYTILGAMRQSGRIPDCKDAQSLLSMVADPENDYVRDIGSVEDGYVVILGTDEMFAHALTTGVFAGDATYKIVTERNRSVNEMNWYLYNIVTRSRTAAIGTPGVVVARFLMNRLSASCYRTVRCMFFNNLRRVLSCKMGVPRSLVSLSVPYLPSPPGQVNHVVNVWSITVDFDVSEIEGIAMALEDERGGTRETHINSMLVGCFVHFERDAKRRASRLSGDKKEGLYNVMMAMHRAESVEDAEFYWEVIRGMDLEWAMWSRRASMKPLVIPAYSKMSAEYRSLAFKDTNIVESQNRRANYLCGIQLDVVVAAKRLRDADRVTIKSVKDGNTVPEARFPKPRKRNLSIVAPTPGNITTFRKKRRPGVPGGNSSEKTRRLGKAALSGSGESQLDILEGILKGLASGISSLSGSSKSEILISLAISIGKETLASGARLKILETLSANSDDKEISGILSKVLEASFPGEAKASEDIPCIILDPESD